MTVPCVDFPQSQRFSYMPKDVKSTKFTSPGHSEDNTRNTRRSSRIRARSSSMVLQDGVLTNAKANLSDTRSSNFNVKKESLIFPERSSADGNLKRPLNMMATDNSSYSLMFPNVEGYGYSVDDRNFNFVPPSRKKVDSHHMSEYTADNSTSKRKRNKTAKDKQWWSNEEDERLREAVSSCGAKNWKLISEMADVGKSDVQCLQRWTQVLRPGLKKGTWTKEEDKRLTKLVLSLTDGPQSPSTIPWKKIEKDMGGRTAKQCRERWKLSLDPNINKTVWDAEEDSNLLALQREYGNSWSKIKDLLGTNRTENAVKLRYKCLKKRQDKFDSGIQQFGSQTVVSLSPRINPTSLVESRKRLKIDHPSTILEEKLKQPEPQVTMCGADHLFSEPSLFSKNFGNGSNLELGATFDSIFHNTDSLKPPSEFHEVSNGVNVERFASTKTLEFDEVLQILSDESSLESWEIV